MARRPQLRFRATLRQNRGDQMTRIIVVALLAAALAHAAPGQEWNQWRGPAREGAVAPSSTPKAWPAKLERTWRVDVGEGYSSPVISAGRVFVHSRHDPEELVTAVDLATGKTLWQKKYPAPFQKNQYAVRMAKGPNSTPLAAGDRLFTLGTTGILSAWNVKSGALLWRKDFSDAIDTSKMFCGTAMSPLLEGGAIIVQVGSDVHGGRQVKHVPSLETVQEFKVVTNPYDAQYGRTGGGVISFTTKSESVPVVETASDAVKGPESTTSSFSGSV